MQAETEEGGEGFDNVAVRRSRVNRQAMMEAVSEWQSMRNERINLN